jgi:hypothetical protein
MASTIGKEATFVECLLVHSAKVLTKGPLATSLSSANPADTRQREKLFVECHLIRSAKGYSLASVT